MDWKRILPGIVVALILVLPAVYLARAQQSQPEALAKDCCPMTKQEDVVVRPRGKAVPPLQTLEWKNPSGVMEAGDPGKLADYLLKDLKCLCASVKGKRQEAQMVTFKVSKTTVTIMRVGNGYEWKFSPGEYVECKHDEPGKTCTKDGIPPEFMGELTGNIEATIGSDPKPVKADELYLKVRTSK